MTTALEPVYLIILWKYLSSYSCVRKAMWRNYHRSRLILFYRKFQWQPLQTGETHTINVKSVILRIL